MILVTGSRGLIGHELVKLLERDGHAVRTFDLRDDSRQDIRNTEALAAALSGASGIVHLAAVSRVVWAERDPALCEAVNFRAFTGLMEIVCASPRPLWVIFASSREVYGEPASIPVAETAPLSPLNIYARSKVAGEKLMRRAAGEGIVANIARFSNVYGNTADHPDRVVPAFARAAAIGGPVRLEGPDNMFDFTHVADVASGLQRLVEMSIDGRQLDPVHFVTGRGTTLRDLAGLALQVGGGGVTCEEHAPRNYDVARFTGDPAQASEVLGWTARVPIAEGFAQLAEAFRTAGPQASPITAFPF